MSLQLSYLNWIALSWVRWYHCPLSLGNCSLSIVHSTIPTAHCFFFFIFYCPLLLILWFCIRFCFFISAVHLYIVKSSLYIMHCLSVLKLEKLLVNKSITNISGRKSLTMVHTNNNYILMEPQLLHTSWCAFYKLGMARFQFKVVHWVLSVSAK